MEEEKRASAANWTPVAAVVIAVISLTASFVAVGLAVQVERRTTLENDNLRKMIHSLSMKIQFMEGAKSTSHNVVKRADDDDDNISSWTTTSAPAAALPCQPGMDGRDGRDGKDGRDGRHCDFNLLQQVFTGWQNQSEGVDDKSREEMIQMVNETLGAHLVKLITRATERISAVEEELSGDDKQEMARLVNETLGAHLVSLITEATERISAVEEELSGDDKQEIARSVNETLGAHLVGLITRATERISVVEEELHGTVSDEIVRSVNETLGVHVVSLITGATERISAVEEELSGNVREEVVRSVNETLGAHLAGLITGATERISTVEDELSTSADWRQLSGSQYIRWGRKSCPDVSELIYEGFAAGQHYTHKGGSSDRVCLPLEPEYNRYTLSNNHLANWIYGAEYELDGTGSNIFPSSKEDQNIPCATCYSPGRSTSLMIPAKRTCPDDTWTKEYEGYLMSEKADHYRASYTCVDGNPQVVDGQQVNMNGALFYFVQADCPFTAHCPPYVQGAELTCVVCTR